MGFDSATHRPLISVCIPAYNADRYLEATLAAVAAQTFADWEVIVTEDGSKDRVEAIVATFRASVRQPVIYNRHTKNQGLAATRNTGIASARGTWVAFLDADDLWMPQHLALLVNKASASTCDLVFSGTEIFDDVTGRVLGRNVPSPEHLEQLPVSLYCGRLSILPSAVMVRREAFKRYGDISLSYPHVNDTEYWLRLLRGGGKIVYSGGVTCRYRRHASNMSSRFAELLADSGYLCESYADWDAIPQPVRSTRPADLFRWAGRTLLDSDPVGAQRILQHALKLQPTNWKTLLLFTKAVARRSFSRRAHSAVHAAA